MRAEALLVTRDRALPALEAAAKRALDVVASASALVVLGPLIAGTASAVWLSMGSPVVFRQRRPGLDGVPFELVKFRTMLAPRPGEDLVGSDARRLTPVGLFLRQRSLDELPTLWNVLKGDMSLVGPRPLLMQYLDRYTPEQARRHLCKPGVTGWAQVHGRNALDWNEKLALDVWYVDHRSLWLDLTILARTVGQVLRREGISHGGEATMPEFRGTAS
jgi:lipopolysaccharide/colanic/teichoic acid biosynthesis glycosyltransferase